MVFVRRDDVPRARYAFEVFDAESGEPIDEFHVLFGRDGRWLPRADRASSGQPYRELAQDVGFRWMVRAPGYRPGSGDETAFTGAGDARTATVRLEPGWGAAVLVRDAGFLQRHSDAVDYQDLRPLVSPPVPGARVLADGVEVATADETGFAPVALDGPPGRLEAHRSGWRWVGGDGLEKGRVRPERGEFVLWMERD